MSGPAGRGTYTPTRWNGDADYSGREPRLTPRAVGRVLVSPFWPTFRLKAGHQRRGRLYLRVEESAGFTAIPSSPTSDACNGLISGGEIGAQV